MYMSGKIHIIIIGKMATFCEMAYAIKDCLLNYGYDVEINSYMPRKDLGSHLSKVIYDCKESEIIKYGKINIFIRGHRVIPDSNCTNILIQTEQNPIYCRDKNIWAKILEFFPELVDVNSEYFPLGYSKYFDTMIDNTKEKQDFFFFGSKTTRRRRLCRKFNIPMEHMWGNTRDELIMATKINVNCKANRKYFYAPLRGLLVMCKGKILLQEKCNGGYGIYKKYPIIFNEKIFEKVSKKWLEDEEGRKEYGMKVREDLMANHRFEDYFEKAMKGIL